MTGMNAGFEEADIHPGDNVLFILIRAMGDALLSTPLIKDFKLRYPEVNIEVMVEPLPAQVLENNPYIAEIHISPQRNSSWTSYLPLLKKLRCRNYKLVIDSISTPGSALIARLTAAKHRIGYRLRGRTWAYIQSVPRRRESLYSSLTKYDLLASLGVRCSSPLPQLFPIDANRQNAVTFLKKKKLSEDDALIGLAPWSKREWRRWNTKGWFQLMRSIDPDSKYNWLLFASNTERDSLRDLEKTVYFKVLWVEADHILDAASVMSNCRMVVGSDNGLMHVAIASGVPTLTIFQPYPGVDPVAWAPPGYVKHQYLIAPSSDEGMDVFMDKVKSLFVAFIGE